MRNRLAAQSKMLPVQSGLEGDDVIKSSCEERGVGGSNPSSLTKFTANAAPAHITNMMCEALGVTIHDRVLEPSAGSGGMCDIIAQSSADITAIELNADLHKELQRTAHPHVRRTFRQDFLSMSPDTARVNERGVATRIGYFDKVIMCPPARSDEHITHAIKFLRPGGKLMALVQRQNIDEWKYHYYPLADKFEFNGEPLECGLVLWAELVDV